MGWVNGDAGAAVSDDSGDTEAADDDDTGAGGGSDGRLIMTVTRRLTGLCNRRIQI